jgi:hypothetical protein
MADFKKTIATAKAKVAKAESLSFAARLEAIDAILDGRRAARRAAAVRARPGGSRATLLRGASS